MGSVHRRAEHAVHQERWHIVNFFNFNLHFNRGMEYPFLPLFFPLVLKAFQNSRVKDWGLCLLTPLEA